MSDLWSARKIGEAMLRRIGAYAVNDSAARPQDMEVALQCLDTLVAELAGTRERFWLVTDNLSLALTADETEYDLQTALGSDWPSEGIEYVRSAWLENSTGKRFPIEIATRLKFDSIYNPEESGQPEMIHVDRLVPSPKLRPRPVPSDDEWTLKLVLQKLSPTIAGVGPIPKQTSGQSLYAGLPASWRRWLEYAGAADIGSGPVRKLPNSTIKEYRDEAAKSKMELEAFQNREHETTPPITGSMENFSDWNFGNTRDAYDPGKRF
jgi:hypothetical protein